MTPRDVLTFDDPVSGLAFSANGNTLAACFRDSSGERSSRPYFAVCDLQTGGHQILSRDDDYTLHRLAFSPEGTTLVSANPVQFWDTRSWQVQRTLDPEEVGCGSDLVFSPDGQLLAFAQYAGTLFLWSMVRREQLPAPRPCYLFQERSPVFSPSGTHLAFCTCNTLGMWDVQAGEVLWSIRTPLATRPGVAFSPDGRTLVSLGYDAKVRLWDAQTGRRLARVPLPLPPLRDCESFSPDGWTLAVGGGGVTLYSTRTGRVRLRLGHHTAPVLALAFSPDGRTLAAGGCDRTITLWDVEPAEEEPLPSESPAPVRVAVPGEPARRLEEEAARANASARLHTAPLPVNLLHVPGFAAAARMAILLHPRRGEEPPRNASKIGGSFLWPRSRRWPTCKEHRDFFVPVLQVAARDFPELRFPRGKDLLQVLWCPHPHEQCDYAPRPRLFWWQAAAITDPLEEMPLPPSPEGEGYVPFPCRLNPERVVEYDGFDDALRKVFDELAAENDELFLDRDEFVAPGWKLGGYPRWVQCDEDPRCDSCGRAMEHLLTIADYEFHGSSEVRWLPLEERQAYFDDDQGRDSIESPTGVYLGDVGRQHLFVCYACDPSKVKAYMQCS